MDYIYHFIFSFTNIDAFRPIWNVFHLLKRNFINSIHVLLCFQTSIFSPLSFMGNLNDRERFPTPDFDGFLFWGCNVFESYKPNDVLLYVSLWKQLQFHLLVNYRVTLLECKNDNSRTRNWNFHISKIILGSKLMNILLRKLQ